MYSCISYDSFKNLLEIHSREDDIKMNVEAPTLGTRPSEYTGETVHWSRHPEFTGAVLKMWVWPKPAR